MTITVKILCSYKQTDGNGRDSFHYSNVTQILELLLSYMPKVSDLSSTIILIVYCLTTQLGPLLLQLPLKERTVNPPDLQIDLLPSCQSHSICQYFNQIVSFTFFFLVGVEDILKVLSLYTSGQSSYNSPICMLQSKSTTQKHDSNLHHI